MAKLLSNIRDHAGSRRKRRKAEDAIEVKKAERVCERPVSAFSPRALWSVLFVVALGAPGPLTAETIGSANSVRPDVSGGNSTIKDGDGVTQGEVIKSGPKGSTKIGFNDGTSLSIGSSAQVTLSHFVYNDNKTFKKATFDLGKGVFRFVTGASDKSAYEIKTPTSTISVRGTVFTVIVTSNSTCVDVKGGSVDQSGAQPPKARRLPDTSDPGEGLSNTITTVVVYRGSVSFCQGSNCQTVDAGQSANDGGDAKNSCQNGQNKGPIPNAPQAPVKHGGDPPPPPSDPYTPPSPDKCGKPHCSDGH
ncbi:FecR family protein [Methylocystis bryophila]|uniref:FecR protein domain-containing protein n=1 Tax=Methylocystis bryophila TaxID=655015 RepID=A0A1W6MT92_9HYPH|nr:FecR domain-containing protein [Methylocystis bryophila]ARN80818.1 hypothetical protein B1812_06725 [Methylocystis bryophila]BDV40905.1 hypothetical protein DSM21852_41580 [Methylocystis bryophila]